jgi:hypothetical protein
VEPNLGTARKIKIRFGPIRPVMLIFLIAVLALSAMPAALAGTFQLVPNTTPTPVEINGKRYIIIKKDGNVLFKVAQPPGLQSIKWKFSNGNPGDRNGVGPHDIKYDKEAGWGAVNPVQIEVKRKVGDQNCNTPFKRVAAVVIPKFVTPAGDPVAYPKDTGDGQNEFTFNTASPGILTINLKAIIAGGIATSIVNDLKFEVDAVGTSTLEWDTANPDGKPTANGNTITAVVKFKNLPDSNSAFGKKKARLKFKNRLVAEAEYEVFFPKNETNHPGVGAGTDPNWYFYWLQTSANKTNTAVEYVGPVFSSYNYAEIKLGDPASTTSVASWGTPKGIDCFGWVTAHEAKHHTQITGFWPINWLAASDSDSDWLPNDQETTYMPGRNYDPNNAATFADVIGYGQNPIPDFEDICMRSQASPYGLDSL